MVDPFSPKQVEFIKYSNAKFNLAHGAIRSGKTVCTLFRFVKAVIECPGESIAIVGYSQGTIYNNVISLLLNSEELRIFRPFCTWSKGNHELYIGTKTIKCIGAGDEGALGQIQGITLDLVYCDEMTLYPDNVINMIKTRLSRDHSKLFASMNPRHPGHPIHRWIELAEEGDPLYYSMHFTIDDNPYISESYKEDLRRTNTGLFYKRYYLGIWCLAEGAIFDFFDKALHTTERPPAAEYFIAGIDHGTHNPTACVLIGVNTGVANQVGKRIFVIDEYYWDPTKTHRQKTVSEFAEDISRFLNPYGVKSVYLDPSAAALRLDLVKKGIHVTNANNEVLEGIETMCSLMQKGVLTIDPKCKHLIREIEGYVWDPKKAKLGEDAPLKHADHAIDALRYAVATHKVSAYQNPMKQQGWDGVNRGQWRMG